MELGIYSTAIVVSYAATVALLVFITALSLVQARRARKRLQALEQATERSA